jgi:predicted DNA-binding protein
MRFGMLDDVATTTIRIDREVHQRLIRLGSSSGQQLMDVVRDATLALERARYAEAVSAEIDALRQDPAAWNAYVADADLAVGDGVSR